MAKQRSRKNKRTPKSKRKSRAMAALASADAVLRQPAELYPKPEAWLDLMGKNAAAFVDLQNAPSLLPLADGPLDRAD